MLWVISAAGLIGIMCGCLYRAPALIFLSFISFGWTAILLLLSGFSLGEMVLTALVVTGALQLGYFVGAGFATVFSQIRPRIAAYRRGGLGVAGIPPASRRWPLPNGWTNGPRGMRWGS
jgi:hypothetical protein